MSDGEFSFVFLSFFFVVLFVFSLSLDKSLSKNYVLR